jgi:3-deoxy-D-manno-octulosonate 8-phosphate phosphatase KdsC-like HAD superfamily phosphatase
MERIKKEFTRFPDFETAINYLYPETKEKLNDLLIIDIDGILIKMDPKTFLRGIYLMLFKKKEFEEYLKEKKIPLGYLLKIKRLINSGVKVILLTSRYLSKEKNCFPFISKEAVKRFENSGIKILNLRKYNIVFEIPEEILKSAAQKDRIIYLGSSVFDKRVFNKLKNEIKDKKINYFDIGFGKII